MLEKDMEELIAKFPNEFFSPHNFVLKGRQQVFAGTVDSTYFFSMLIRPIS